MVPSPSASVFLVERHVATLPAAPGTPVLLPLQFGFLAAQVRDPLGCSPLVSTSPGLAPGLAQTVACLGG